MREKIPGIIGGMGPEATVDLMQKIIDATPAIDDADHIRCLIDNNPKIPSRIDAILGNGGENPGPCMAEMGKNLERWGADFLVIPCNTAHYYYNYVVEAVTIPVINLIDLVVAEVLSKHSDLEEIGILGSTTVVRTGLYLEGFSRHGVRVVYPDSDVQEQLFQIIRRVKRGDTGQSTRADFAAIGDHLKKKNVHLAVLGCTELGIIADMMPITCLDAAQILATEVVALAKNRKPLVQA